MTVQPTRKTPTTDVDRTAEIYRTAAHIFNKKGYHATSISEIAEAVQLTKAGLYYYIKGKQQLLFAIMTFAMDRLDTEVIEPARRELDPEARLRAILARHALMITDDATLTILVNELEGLTPAHRVEIAQRQRDYVDFVRATLEALARQGKLADVDLTVAAFGIIGAVLWIARWYRPEGRLGPERVIDDVAKLVVNGVLAPRLAVLG